MYQHIHENVDPLKRSFSCYKTMSDNSLVKNYKNTKYILEK